MATASGRLAPVTALNMHDDVFDCLRQFQFFQERPGELTLKYQSSRPLTDQERDRVSRRVLERLDSDVALHLQPVDHFEFGGRGKHRMMIQQLDLGASNR